MRVDCNRIIIFWPVDGAVVRPWLSKPSQELHMLTAAGKIALKFGMNIHGPLENY